MQSRRDQIHSYQFFLHRVISSLVARQGDPAELPFRRLGGAALGSVMVAVLALAAAGVYGIIAGGGATSWQKGTFVIVEKDTGTRYVYRDRRLHQVLNFASARLLLGQAAKTKLVSAKSLRGVPRGPALGIPGAPDTLPPRTELLRGDWLLCTALVPDGRGGRQAQTTLGVGVRPAAAGTALTGAQGLLVRVGTTMHLVWNNHRFPITDPGPVLLALGARAEQALPVAPAWVDALPAGATLAAVRVTGAGTPTTAFRTAEQVRTGQVVVDPAGRFYLVRADRLEPLTPLQKDIALADPSVAPAYGGAAPAPVQVGTAAVAGASVSGMPTQSPAVAPATRPDLVAVTPADQADGAACVGFAPGRPVPAVLVGGRPPADPGIETPKRTDAGGLLADRVVVAPGRAVLAQAVPAPDADGGSLHLVTDQGIRYGLATPDVAAMLGYDRSRAVRLPSSLLDRLPAGPPLDPLAAARPA